MIKKTKDSIRFPAGHRSAFGEDTPSGISEPCNSKTRSAGSQSISGKLKPDALSGHHAVVTITRLRAENIMAVRHSHSIP